MTQNYPKTFGKASTSLNYLKTTPKLPQNFWNMFSHPLPPRFCPKEILKINKNLALDL